MTAEVLRHNEITDSPSKPARLLVREGVLPESPTARTFSHAHPMSGRDVSLAQARAFRFFLPLFRGSGRGCPQLRASNEHILIVRVLRARRTPGRSPDSFTELRTSVRRRSL